MMILQKSTQCLAVHFPLLTQDACSGERRLEDCPGGVAGGLYLYQRSNRIESLAQG